MLHGITSSGKTEVYIHLILEYLKKGKQVLYLLPEIALTAQIINRLKRVFGNKIGIYHSKFSDSERVETWENIRKKKDYQIIYFNGCSTYGYYNRQYFKKKKGSKHLEIISSGLQTAYGDTPKNNMALIYQFIFSFCKIGLGDRNFHFYNV